MSDNPCCVWDFTVPESHASMPGLKVWLKENCKSWAFQLEEGESGYRHFQGRFSLKLKKRKVGVIDLFCNPKGHISLTSSENKDNCFYVLKDDSRIEGPWLDTDYDPYIPRDVREMKELWPFQAKIKDMSQVYDPRVINMIICPRGKTGKSSIVRYMCVHGFARQIPFANDYKDLLRIVMDMPKSKCYMIDMPRAINKERLYQWTAACETIKDGYAYDDRYKFRDEYFDKPCIFVFCNKDVDESGTMSADRWRKWTIVDRQLVPWEGMGFSDGACAVTLENPLIR